MGNSKKTKFIIKDISAVKEILNPLEKNFSIPYATKDAILDMRNRIAEIKHVIPESIEIDAAYSDTTIRKNLKEGVVTQKMLHSILCLLLNEFEEDNKYSQTYTSISIKEFLEQLKLEYNEPGSVKKFREFFSSLIIPEKFGDFEIRIDADWNFDLTEKIEPLTNGKEISNESNKAVIKDEKKKNELSDSQLESIREAAAKSHELYGDKKISNTEILIEINEIPEDLTEFKNSLTKLLNVEQRNKGITHTTLIIRQKPRKEKKITDFEIKVREAATKSHEKYGDKTIPTTNVVVETDGKSKNVRGILDMVKDLLSNMK